MFPISIRNIFYTWVSLRPWAQSLIQGIPGWPLVIFICVIAATANAFTTDVAAAVVTSLFIVMWYGSIWAMGQTDIRELTFKSGRAWFIGAIIVYLASMVSVAISIPLLIAGIYAIYAWDQLIAARKWRFMAIGIGSIFIALTLNYFYPGKFVFSDITWALPLLVVLIAPKQVDRFISWVYSAITFGVVGFIAIAGVANSVPEQQRGGIIAAILVVVVAAIIWVKKSSRGKLMKAAHEEKKQAAANSVTGRKLRRIMFAAVMGIYVVLHGILAIDMQGTGSVGGWLMVMLAAVYVWTLGYRLDLYDKHHIAAHESNTL